MVAARPVFDFIADFTAGPPYIPGVNAVSLNSLAGTRTQDWSTRRGRQYELGTAEAGALTLNVFDRAENLNPVNANSPWNMSGNSLLPYRCIQRHGFWNPTSLNLAGNLLNSANTPPGSTSFCDPSFESGVAWVGNFGSSATFAQSTAQAFNGTHSCAITLTGSGDVVGAGLWTIPGQTYTMSAYVYVPAGYTVTLAFGQFSPTVTTYGSATSTTTGAWQRLVVTAVATNAVSYFAVEWVSGTPFPVTVYLDACQLELASSASTFTTAGPTRYVRYTGYTERYPQTWTDAGFRGMKPLEAVDALSVLSRTVINQSYQSTILADSPYAYVPFSDKAPPFAVQLPAAGQPFLGNTLLGNSSSSVSFGGDSFLDGSSAASIAQQNAKPTVSGNPAYITYAIARNGLLYMNPAGFTVECWVKVSSGTCYLGAAAVQPTETVGGEATGPSYYAGWYTSAGALLLRFGDPNGSGNALYAIGNGSTYSGYPDGQWHHLVLIFPDGVNVQSVVDGVAGGLGPISGTLSQAIGLNAFFVNATTYFGDPVTQIAVANMAVYPYALTTSQAQAHYNRGAGYINEVSGSRVARLLAAYWSSVNYTAAPGMAALAPDFNYDPVGAPQSARTMLDVLQEISATENGFVYANTAGAVVFEDRSSRYSQQTSTATIGNGTGQIHPDVLEYDYDPTYVYSQCNLSRPANSNFPPQINATAQANYGQRILSATLQVNTDFDLSQAATFYLARYAVPGGAPGTMAGPRVRKLVINPAVDPSRWNFVLGLELSQRITISMVTSAGVTMTYDYYVENIAESGNPADGSYTVELQTSPVFVPTAGVLGDATYGVLGSTTYIVY